MKHIYLIILLVNQIILAQSGHTNAHNTKNNFHDIYPFALRGEMNSVFEILDGLDEQELSQKQIKRKADYKKRFLTLSEDFDFRTQDKEIIDLFKRFQNYWRSVIVEEVDQKKADRLFLNELAAFMQKNYKPELSLDEIKKDHSNVFQSFLESKGIYGLSIGKTGHLFDLYLWKKQEEKIYDISLPEGKVKVPVVFMRDFISNGWSHYTTFGRSFSGGWAKPDKLYCVEESYDLESENFNVSYISHEGQHFMDYKTFPKLKQANLEYRAKLTELALAKKSHFDVIKKFIHHGKNDDKYAHAFANYHVIKNLSLKVFKTDYVDDIEKWKNISVKEISKASVSLLKENTKKLKKLGADTVETGLL